MAAPAGSPRPLKVIAGADSFGCALKDALVAHLRSLSVDVEDLGTDKYYSVGQEICRRVSSAAVDPSAPETRGLFACGTGVGVSIFANKYPGVYAATCESVDEALNTRSINNCNVLAVGGMKTPPEEGVQILDAWLNTPFLSPCPAFGDAPWSANMAGFLGSSLSEMAVIPEKLPGLPSSGSPSSGSPSSGSPSSGSPSSGSPSSGPPSPGPLSSGRPPRLEILPAHIRKAWLENRFPSCPASGDAPWSADIADLLGSSLSEMALIPEKSPGPPSSGPPSPSSDIAGAVVVGVVLDEDLETAKAAVQKSEE